MQKTIALFFFFCFTCGILPVYAQLVEEKKPTETTLPTITGKPEYHRKGKLSVYWGYNRSAYTKSDIHLTGSGYDFIIKDVKSTDSPTKKISTYVTPKWFTVPQYDWRIGYNLTDKYIISLGQAHMKYQITEQIVKIEGTISEGENAGEYNDMFVMVGEESEHADGEASPDGHSHSHGNEEYPKGIVSVLEHCDGLNNFTVELGRKDNLWVSSNGKHCLSFETSLDLGASVTDTEAKVLGKTDPNHGNDATEVVAHSHDDTPHGGSWNGYHLAGFTTSASASFQMDLYQHIFIQARLRGGYVNLQHFITTTEGGRGSQQFGFVEGFIVLGYTFQLIK